MTKNRIIYLHMAWWAYATYCAITGDSYGIAVGMLWSLGLILTDAELTIIANAEKKHTSNGD